jgi:hypothetical protein
VVEQRPEKPCVGSSILLLGTIEWLKPPIGGFIVKNLPNQKNTLLLPHDTYKFLLLLLVSFPSRRIICAIYLHFFNPSLSGGFLFLIFYMNEVIHDLEELKAMIQPGNISYISWGGALPSRALEVWKIIWEIDNPGLLEELLIHANTLAREPNLDEDKTYPISTVREAIQKRLNALKI